jgi:hypothetical protein
MAVWQKWKIVEKIKASGNPKSTTMLKVAQKPKTKAPK